MKFDADHPVPMRSEPLSSSHASEEIDDAGLGYAKPLLMLKQNSTLIRRAMLVLPSWITPNGVTVFRATLIVPIAWLIVAGQYGPAVAVLACAMLLDFVDGALAQARDQKTEMGAFLDPLADKVLTCGTFFCLAPKLPWAFAPAIGIMCGIAILLTVTRVIKMVKAHRDDRPATVAASPAGKLKLMAETAALLLTLLGVTLAWPVCIWLGFIALLVSTWYAASSLNAQQQT